MRKIILLLIFLAFLSLVKADVYMGTCEGYVYNTEGQLVSSAKVIATVDRCIVACSQETLTGANGYYVVANLNLPKLETLTAYAEKMTALGLEFGSNQGTANEYQAARIDIVICLPPPPPILVTEPDAHATSTTLEWISYADKKGYSTHDEFQIDSQPVITKPGAGDKSETIADLSFSSHTWQVRTCNPFCCSEWVSESFAIGNSPPSAPILIPEPDTAPAIIELDWTSGIDPDGDETYDDYSFGIANEPTNTTTATSPQEEEVIGCNYYVWKVRTCEKESQNLCSDWSEDGFIACGLTCPSCSPSAPSGSGGGGGVERCPVASNQPYSLFLSYPPYIEEELPLVLDVGISPATTITNIKASVDSQDFVFSDFMISQISGLINARFNMTGNPKETTKKGYYRLTLNIFINNRHTFSESFTIEVKEPPSVFVRITKKLTERGKPIWWWLLFIFILIAAIIALVIVYRKIKKKKLHEIKKPFKFFPKKS